MLLALLGALPAGAQGVTRGPYLQRATDTSVVVRWRTDLPTDSVVRFGTALPPTGEVGDATPKTEHVVTLAALLPDTPYFYAVGNALGTLAGGDASHRFVTAPVPGSAVDVRVWVLGDSGKANAGAAAVRDAYQAWTGARGTDVWLMLGDNAYDDGTDAEFQAAVFDMYPEVLRQVPLWPTLGNHDTNSASSATQTGPYFDLFTLPSGGEAGGVASGTEAYYAFDYANVHFVCLDSDDSDRSPGGAMLTWLEADLQANVQPWTVVYFHHPPYARGGFDSDADTRASQMRANALPLLEAHGVDLVLSGHDHNYQRSFLVDGHYGQSETFAPGMTLDGGDGRVDGTGPYQKTTGGTPHGGTVYVVNGAGSSSGDGPFDHPTTWIGIDTLGSLVLDVDGDRLDARFVDDAGAVVDHFTIDKGPDEVAPQLLAVEALGPTQVALTFSEALDGPGAETASYSVGPLESVLAATLQPDSRTVWLTTSRMAPGNYNVAAFGVTDRSGNAMPLVVTPFSFDATGSWQGRLEVGGDDAEQDAIDGGMSLGSGDLELGFDGPSPQVVGLRFREVGIPAGSVIQSARIQFQADEPDLGVAELLLEAEAADDAAPFQSASNDLDARARTQAQVAWTPPTWLGTGDAGPAQQTPELGALVQEVVDRPGWQAGNALVVLVSGTGTRPAESVEGAPAGAPLLTVDYAFALPACSDGIDNDGDLAIDHPSDPGCASDSDASEASVPPGWGCGLGPEVGAVLALLLVARPRRRRGG